MKQHTVIVENVKCGGCANSIKNKLNTIEGVSNLSVQIEEGSVSFTALNDSSIALVEDTLLKMGYPKSGENDFSAKAKSYVSCMIGKIS